MTFQQQLFSILLTEVLATHSQFLIKYLPHYPLFIDYMMVLVPRPTFFNGIIEPNTQEEILNMNI